MENLILGFAFSLGECTITQAEIWALYHGINLAWSRDFRQIHMESDSISAISIINYEATMALGIMALVPTHITTIIINNEVDI